MTDPATKTTPLTPPTLRELARVASDDPALQHEWDRIHSERQRKRRASATSSAYSNNLGALRSLGLITYPSQGYVAAAPVMFLEGR